MLGTVVNTIAIIIGTLIGILLRKGITERYKDTIMQGLGLAVGLIGINMAIKTANELVVILSLVVGGLIGETLEIDNFLNRLGQRLNQLVKSGEGDFVRAFVSTSLVYCVGAMAIMGSLQSGLTGEHKILFAKATLDGISAIVFASTMGIGVLFSALSVFVYQGAITMLAGGVKVLLTDAVIREMTATGGLLIIGVASNILGIKQFKVANLLPAVFVAIAFASLAARWFTTVN
ncbi:MAG: hypothetical protein FD167_3986 [bacterium]|nr:MAG: hypothetical protein FD167_3986 [bacterium]